MKLSISFPIKPFPMEMYCTLSICEMKFNNLLAKKIQQIAMQTVIPIILLAAIEGVVYNLILINSVNLGINLLNGLHALALKVDALYQNTSSCLS